MTYKHFNLSTDDKGDVWVYDPRWPQKPIYLAPSLFKAKAWIRALQRGEHWAVMAYLP